MNFENLAKTWDSFGIRDPMWAVLAWEGKKDNNWNPKEFFDVGEGEIKYILHQAEERMAIQEKKKSLDFGCGVGRLTFPLARYFDESHGVDISEQMIRHALRFSEELGIKNCTFHHNRREDLRIFPDQCFDFILSIIVLQHMEPKYFLSYINEFLRVLKKSGLLIFQLPDATENRAGYDEFANDTEPVMEMYGMAKTEIVTFITKNGGKILDVVEDESCGKDLRSFRYFVSR